MPARTGLLRLWVALWRANSSPTEQRGELDTLRGQQNGRQQYVIITLHMPINARRSIGTLISICGKDLFHVFDGKLGA
jgi:hypothetical protein